MIIDFDGVKLQHHESKGNHTRNELFTKPDELTGEI
jgi:hypothetical protein